MDELTLLKNENKYLRLLLIEYYFKYNNLIEVTSGNVLLMSETLKKHSLSDLTNEEFVKRIYNGESISEILREIDERYKDESNTTLTDTPIPEHVNGVTIPDVELPEELLVEVDESKINYDDTVDGTKEDNVEDNISDYNVPNDFGPFMSVYNPIKITADIIEFLNNLYKASRFFRDKRVESSKGKGMYFTLLNDQLFTLDLSHNHILIVEVDAETEKVQSVKLRNQSSSEEDALLDNIVKIGLMNIREELNEYYKELLDQDD